MGLFPKGGDLGHGDVSEKVDWMTVVFNVFLVRRDVKTEKAKVALWLAVFRVLFRP